MGGKGKNSGKEEGGGTQFRASTTGMLQRSRLSQGIIHVRQGVDDGCDFQGILIRFIKEVSKLGGNILHCCPTNHQSDTALGDGEPGGLVPLPDLMYEPAS